MTENDIQAGLTTKEINTVLNHTELIMIIRFT
jgi:hypothetical protein